ncbi:MAG: hypothetical protein JW839_13155 [Candidatus Lokiarchaeota archaeon]|nr:hypothetical protein [Candidatus Lokiarchaeota archaeon]
MRAIAGSIVSTVAAVLYVIVVIQFALIEPSVLEADPDNFFEALIWLLMAIAFMPLHWVFIVVGIVVCGLIISGTILVGLGKTKPGGILVIVGSGVGCIASMLWYFIPLAVGITGGILALNEK